MKHGTTIHQKVLLVAGPTASGKSRLACTIAGAIGGEIICCDALQVYKDWHLLTTRPTPQEERVLPHHLYGFVTRNEGFSVGKWRSIARNVVKDILSRGKIPILVGGTGLYFRCFLEGLPSFPPIPQSITMALKKQLKEEGSDGLHRELAKCDPSMAKGIAPQDAYRIIRALAVYRISGLPMSLWQKTSSLDAFEGSYAGLFLQADQKQLRSAITERLNLMMEHGLIEEVRKVASYELEKGHPLLKPHGALPMISHVRGELSLSKACEITITRTLQYVRKQNIWAKRYMNHWQGIPHQTSSASVIKSLKRFSF